MDDEKNCSYIFLIACRTIRFGKVVKECMGYKCVVFYRDSIEESVLFIM